MKIMNLLLCIFPLLFTVEVCAIDPVTNKEQQTSLTAVAALRGKNIEAAKQAADFLMNDNQPELLLEALQSPVYRINLIGIDIARELKSDVAEDALIEAIRNHPNREDRNLANFYRIKGLIIIALNDISNQKYSDIKFDIEKDRREGDAYLETLYKRLKEIRAETTVDEKG